MMMMCKKDKTFYWQLSERFYLENVGCQLVNKNIYPEVTKIYTAQINCDS